MFRKKAKPSQAETRGDDAIPEKLPRHIAIIMDGNGRWAKARGLPRMAGHAAGSENFRRIATFCKDIGIEYLTVYAFSTENWARPADEIEGIFNLLRKYLDELLQKMVRDRVRIRFLGDVSVLPADIRESIRRAEDVSKTFEGVLVSLCVNYGGRDEILRAARILQASGGEITPESFSAQLYTSGIPDPEICIRPSGEIRLSNFLLWQTAYTEFFFTKTLWPDFSQKELTAILNEYTRRNRRFGGV
ncbi:MAG: di-trans,poly-cis-decaprenylcistransferase [Oscillospiraceae bacterium]|nr:di-trans,poly-cis-decaprenylcistransferase [Oscillospiraceae bacterium]